MVQGFTPKEIGMLSESTIQAIRVWRKTLQTKRGTVNQAKIESERQRWANENPLDETARKEIRDYYDAGNGFKIIAKELGISYTQTRRLLLSWIGIDARKGMSVITDALRKKRSENARGERSPFFNWVERFPERAKVGTKSLQGWYTRQNGEQVWLRSCLEYIYAKWLDSRGVLWNTEVRTFKGDNETYRPDFFIYDNKGNLVRVVEIKGNYFDNVDKRSEKAKRICESHGVSLEIVRDITPYIKDGSYYHKELKQWKLQRQQSVAKSN
jgi:hypothetical protein